MKRIPAPPQKSEERKSVPLRGVVMIAWLVVYLLLMWHSGWPWEAPRGASVLATGMPSAVTLERSGAMVPALATWERFLLSPWLHRSLLGVLLLVWFWSGTARQMISMAGVARTWILFVLGGAAGAAAHWLSYPESMLAAGAGPFDAIAVMIGASLCWSVRSKAPHAKRVRNSAIVTILIVGILIWWQTKDLGPNSEIGKLVGLEAMLAAFGAGIVLMALFGPRRVAQPAGAALRALAIVLTLGVVAAGVSQGAGLLASADRSAAGAFLDRLESAEQAAWELSRDQLHATESKRGELNRRLERVLAEAFLEDYEGLDALRAYVAALRAYTQPVRLPWVAEGECRKTFEAWYEGFEKELRESRGLAPRLAIRFYWKKP